MPTIIFSHGFGVDKTDRGLFTDILAELSNAEGVMFDYNDVEASGDMTVRPLSQQAEALKKVIETIRQDQPGPINLICHSQGCVVAGMVKPGGIDKIILLNPPFKLSVDHLVKMFGDRPGTSLDLHGVSKLARADGTTTSVPSKYWEELSKIEPIGLYNSLNDVSEITLFTAKQDHILKEDSTAGLKEGVRLIELEGDHNFSGPADRKIMIQKVKSVLNTN